MSKKNENSSAEVYIISKIGWEYNDETYYRPESEAGYPEMAFTIRELAIETCDEMNLKAFGENLIGEDLYSYNEIISEDLLEQLSLDFNISELGGNGDYHIPSDNWEKLSKEDKFKLMREIGIDFFEVIKVSLVA